jgi:cob(I)alamin adenosyltransferase
MKIYTKTGDKGSTSLFGGVRVPKSHARLNAYGTIDELNSHIGYALALETQHPSEIGLGMLLMPVQNELFTIGSHLATPYNADTVPKTLPAFPAEAVNRIEQQIDILTAQLPELKTFILPGGSPVAAQLHICRTVCRRAERLVVDLVQTEYVLPEIIAYLNRLSDFLFTLNRSVNHAHGIADTPWKK